MPGEDRKDRLDTLVLGKNVVYLKKNRKNVNNSKPSTDINPKVPKMNSATSKTSILKVSAFYLFSEWVNIGNVGWTLPFF